MAKFSIYIETKDYHDNDPIPQIAQQKGLNKDELYDFVRSFYTDYDAITLQFDTEAKTCTVVPAGGKSVNDYDSTILYQSEEDIESENKWREQIKTHENHIDESVEAIDKETNKNSPYYRGLLKYIEDERQAIKEIQEFINETSK